MILETVVFKGMMFSVVVKTGYYKISLIMFYHLCSNIVNIS